MTCVQIRDLGKSFGAREVLRQLNFSIEHGERVALVGQNGSGKTTLIRCLLGLYNYTGAVEVMGFDPRLQRDLVLKKIGFVPQTAPALRMTVDEFLRMTESLCDCPAAAIIECAQNLGLDIPDCRNRPFKNLSGGMKQKLLIAAAMARHPKILIMDEPAASLDPVARMRFFSRLAGMASDTTMILSSHRVDEISGLVSRLIEMDAGVVALDDMIVSGNANTDELLSIDVQFHEMPEMIARNMAEWHLTQGNSLRWTGRIISADRFRFLSMLTRWSGLIKSLHLKKDGT